MAISDALFMWHYYSTQTRLLRQGVARCLPKIFFHGQGFAAEELPDDVRMNIVTGVFIRRSYLGQGIGRMLRSM